jgi:hypothetical protein
VLVWFCYLVLPRGLHWRPCACSNDFKSLKSSSCARSLLFAVDGTSVRP